VVVAVAVVRMVEVIADEVVNMVPMRHGLVPAVGTMLVARVVLLASVSRCTRIRIGLTDLDDVFVDMAAMGVMKVPIVQVIDVIAMTDRRMTAAGIMVMIMFAGVLVVAAAHRCALLSSGSRHVGAPGYCNKTLLGSVSASRRSCRVDPVGFQGQRPRVRFRP